MKLPRTLIVLGLLFVLAGAGVAQEPTLADKQRERQRLVLRARSTIRQIADEAVAWNDIEATVSVLSDAADLLWAEDPNSAANWLRKAWQATAHVSSSPRDENLKAFFTHSSQSELRTTVLAIARKHDSKLADEFLRQVSDQDNNDKRERGAFDNRTARSEQLLNLAQQVVEANPEEAFALAADSLIDGISYGLQNILTTLRRKDVQLANRLFDLALARFINSSPDPSEAQVLAGYLFRPGLTFSVNAQGQKILALNPAQQSLTVVASSEPGRAKSFLIAVYERLLTQPTAVDFPEGKLRAQQILVLGNLIAGRYSAFAPDLAQSALGFLSQLRRQLGIEAENSSSTASTKEPNSAATSKQLTKEETYESRISDLEDSADKESNASFRNVAYVKAALATKPEDYVRAQKIASKISENDLRSNAVSFLLYRAALFFTEKSELETAIELARQINDPARRAVVRIAIAQRLVSNAPSDQSGRVRLERERAFDLLGEVDRDLKKQEPSATVAKIALGRTGVLATLDQEQALMALADALQIVNKLDRFDLRDGAGPVLALEGFSASGATVTKPRFGFDFRTAIGPLIGDNFEPVAAITERLSARETAGVARLEAAKLYLRMAVNSTAKGSVAVGP